MKIFTKKVFTLVLLPLLLVTLAYLLTSLHPVPTQAQERMIDLNLDESIEARDPSVGQNSYNLSGEGLNAFFANSIISIMGARTSTGKLITQGAVPASTHFIARLVTDPPVQTGQYVADLLHHTGLVPQAYAQGIGFSALAPVLEIWKVFRNISYFLFILIFIVIGFMIMFQSKIDHQAVVTIQMAIPKLIITVIAITFSYAIAGFVVDLIYLSIYFITGILDTFGIINNVGVTRNALFGHNILSVGWHHLTGLGDAGLAGSAANEVASLFHNIVGWPEGWDQVVSILAYLIIAVALLIALFRTLFALITAYVGIIIATIFAPLQLLFNALPGSNTFGNWFKGLIANAAVFPAVASMVIIGAAIVGGPAVDDLGIAQSQYVGYENNEGWLPPLLGANVGTTGMNAVRGIIGLGLILLLPEVVNIIREALGVRETLGQLAWQNAQRGTVIITRPIQAIQQTANERQQQVREAEAHGRTAPRIHWDDQAIRWLQNIFGF